jgi:hypothetical protein
MEQETPTPASLPAPIESTPPPNFADAYDADHDPLPAIEVEVPAADGQAPATAPASPAADASANAPPAIPAEPATPRHPPWVYRQAAQFGIPPEDVETMTTEDLKDQIQLTRLEMVALHSNRQPPAPAPYQAPVDELGLDENEVDPGIVNAIRQTRSQTAQELQAVKAQLAHLQQTAQAREFNSFVERFDEWTNAMVQQHPELEPVFGKGTRLTLPASSAPFKHRQEILVHMDSLMQTYSRMGVQMTEKEIYDLAAQTVGNARKPKRAAAAAPATPSPETQQELERRKAQYKQGTLALPTMRSGTEPPGDKKAEAAAREFMEENGMFEADKELADAFPG